MNIIPPAVLTATQLVGSLVASAKNARDMAKDSSNSDLKAAISDLYDDILSIKERVLDLDEENRKLKAELVRQAEIVGPCGPFGYFFYKGKPDQPLCPRCVQKVPSEPRYLGPLERRAGGQMRVCHECGFMAIEVQATPVRQRYNPLDEI